MSERSRLFFFSNTPGALPNFNTPPSRAVETAPPAVQIVEYDKLAATLSDDEYHSSRD